MLKEQVLELDDGSYLAYNKIDGHEEVGVVFLHGFMADKEGIKARKTEAFCLQHDIPFIRFDYLGHGNSFGNITNYNISNWLENVLTILDQLTDRQQILVGYSMGGWLMLLAALQRKQKIAGLIGSAAAPDFTEKLIWNCLPQQKKDELLATGLCDYLHHPITLNLVEDGRNHLILSKTDDIIDLHIPIRLIHSMDDPKVPFITSVQLSQKIATNDVQVTFVKEGSHRMASESNIHLVLEGLSELIETIKVQNRKMGCNGNCRKQQEQTAIVITNHNIARY